MGELHYDEKSTKQLLAVYVTPDVVAQREAFIRILNARPGECVLDVGSGPGFLASDIAWEVGPSGRVCGVDVSEPLLAVARLHCAYQSQVDFRRGEATQLPFPDDEFDAVISTQVLEYVHDIEEALAEIRRVVRPGGRVVVVGTDWDSIVWHSPDRERMNHILGAWEQHAADSYLPRMMADKLHRAGLRVESQGIVPLFNPTYDPNTYSNRLIELIVPFVTGRNGIALEDAEAWARELRQSGERGEYFFSLNRYVFVAKKS
ncbi:MAG: methyltransferase domain-containing protein [Hydrogenophilales bacterium]|nr:methyltransferase domain-containing protein [Hydrogenophilales bacterium]